MEVKQVDEMEVKQVDVMEVKQVDEMEERKEMEEERERLEKEERMRREEEERRRNEEKWESEAQDIPVQVIQQSSSDKSEPNREDGADIIKEVFEVTHDAVMTTDMETQDTRRDDEKEEFKEKKKKKKKDKDKDRDGEDGEEGEEKEKRRRRKKHKHHSREESEGREERRRHRHHHRRREEGGEVVEKLERKIEESHLEKKDEDISKIRDIQKHALDERKTDGSEEKKDREGERKYLDDGSSGGRVALEEVGVLQFEPDDAVGTDVSPEERVEQNPIIANAPDLSDRPGIERRPEHLLDESVNSVEKSDEILVNPMDLRDSDVLSNNTEAAEEKIEPSQVDLEEEEEEEDNGQERRAEEAERRRKRSERRRSKREKEKEKPEEPIAKELPSFRGARAGHAPSVKEGEERENSLAVDDTDDSDDSLVNSDDELVDLFLSHKERLEAKSARQAKQSGDSTGPGNQDLEAETVVKISGKQREEERKEEIRREQRKGRGRETEEHQHQQQGSESVRKALTQLNLGGEEPPAYKREWKAVQLDIVDEDIGLPSLSSTRSNSVAEMSSDEEERRALIEHNMFALKELEKEVERQRSQPVNEALDEAFAKISLTGQHDSYVTVGNTQVVERQDRESPEPKIICETKNFNVRETGRDFDFSDTEENSLSSSQQSSLARGGEGSPDAVRHRQPREAPNVTRGGGEAPSPDSGIHDYAAEQCASPVSSLGLCREEEAAAGPSTPDSGLELHGSVSEVTSSSGADVCLQDVAEEEEEEEDDEGEQQRRPAAIERVELPRRHTGKVLFSMASYNERGPSMAPTPAPRDVARTESYRRVSSQLNSSLAAGMERAKDAERREREEHERKAREERERRNLAENEEQRNREKREQQQKEMDQRRNLAENEEQRNRE